MTDYRIAKHRCPTTVIFIDGRTLDGDIFLDPISRFRAEPQQPAEFFNATEPFFVLGIGENGVLISKDSVACAVTAIPASDSDDELDVARVGMTVEIGLTGGDSFRGWIFPDTQEGRARLVDYLNSNTNRFLVISDAEKLTLVNRNAVTHVREVR